VPGGRHIPAAGEDLPFRDTVASLERALGAVPPALGGQRLRVSSAYGKLTV